MTMIAETMCVGVQDAMVAETTKKEMKAGAEGGDLFAALLAALECTVVAAQGEPAAAAQPAQGAQNAIDVDGAQTGAAGALLVASEDGSGVVMPEQQVTQNVAQTAVPGTSPDISPDVPVDATSGMVPLRSSEVPAFTELLTGQDGAPPPEPDVEGGVPSQPDETNSVRAEGLSVTIRLPVRDGKPVAFVKELGNVETDAAAAEGASTPESVPARAVLTRSPTEVARLKIATIETRQEAPQGGDDLARGSSDRSFPEGMVPQQDVRTRQLTSTTAQDVPRSSSAAEARISQAVIDQTVKGVLLSVRNGSSELRVWLKPDHLGELQMRLVFKDNVLNVDVSTQNTAVKNVIEGNLNQLREMLDRNGVDVGRLSVTVDPELSSGGHFNRSPYAFQPVEGEWTRTYRGHTNDEQGSLDGWFRRAPVGRGANLIDVIA